MANGMANGMAYGMINWMINGIINVQNLVEMEYKHIGLKHLQKVMEQVVHFHMVLLNIVKLKIAAPL